MHNALLEIQNQHPFNGTPPEFVQNENTYIGYFESENGQQIILVVDRPTKTGKLYEGEIGWFPADVTSDGVQTNRTLTDAENIWLLAAWRAATGEALMTPIVKSFLDKNGSLEATFQEVTQ